MKIAWFTPFSLKSAIGRFSQGVVAELAARADVDVLCFDAGETYSTKVPVRKFASASRVEDRILSRYDVIFYNFGNYLPFHREIFEVSRRHPGIAVMHDFVMHHFFAGYYLDYKKSMSGYLGAIERIYGEKMKNAAEKSITRSGLRLWDTDRVLECPMFENVLPGALGVITHSGFFKQRAEDKFAGPVRKIPLAYDVDTTSPVKSRSDLGLTEGRLIILTIGHVNPNKQIVAIIHALAQLRASLPLFEYVIAGSCSREYKKEIEACIRKNHAQEMVKLVGEIPEDTLRGYLMHADVCINLRFPALEGASASAIEEMRFGKPIIVSNLGFYSDLPEDSVLKIDPHSPAELAKAITRLAQDPKERMQMGAAAHSYAESEFRADAYARQALEFVDEVRRSRPLLDLTAKLARECARMGVTREMSLVDTMAGDMGELFGGTASE